ncbi:MAG: hypothetical protein EHM40_21805, partial [Chloroflexi bacterium]
KGDNWTTTRQQAGDLVRMPWQRAQGIAAVCGIGGLRAVDFDHQADRQALDLFLTVAGLPLDYEHAVKTGGGYHVDLLCSDFAYTGISDEKDTPQRLVREGIQGGVIELRHTDCLIMLPPSMHPSGRRYTYLHDTPNGPMATIDPETLIAAYEAVTLPPVPKPAPERATYHAATLGSDASELEEVERRIRQAIANALIKRGHKPGVWECPYGDHGPRGKDFLFDPETGKMGGCQGKHAGHSKRYTDLAEHLQIDVSQIARDVAIERRGSPVLAYGKDTVSKFSQPINGDENGNGSSHKAILPSKITPQFADNPRYFPFGLSDDLIAYSREFGSGLKLHVNPWFHVAPGDMPDTGAMWAFVYTYNEMVLDGQIDPEQGATVNWIALNNTRGLSPATCRKGAQLAADWQLFEFHIPKREIVFKGCESETIHSGRPAPAIRMKPLNESLNGYFSTLETYAGRVLLATEYPDLLVEASDIADLLVGRFDAVMREPGDVNGRDDIAVIDDICQPVYEAQYARYQEFSNHLNRRMYQFKAFSGLNRILLGDYAPLVFDPDVLFSNAAQFKDAVDNADPDLRDGVRQNPYRASNRSGRTMSAQRASCTRRGIVSIPVWSKPIALNPAAPIAPQCKTADPVNFYRGRMKLHAPDGTERFISAAVDRRENIEQWLDDHGGRAGATVTTWDRTIEKQPDTLPLTIEETEAREEISAQQKAISNRRKTIRTPKQEAEPDKLTLWLNDQGERRAELFNLQPIPHESPRIFVSPNGEIFEEVWRGIISQAGEGEVMTLTAYSAQAYEREAEPIEVSEPEQGYIITLKNEGFILSTPARNNVDNINIEQRNTLFPPAPAVTSARTPEHPAQPTA